VNEIDRTGCRSVNALVRRLAKVSENALGSERTGLSYFHLERACALPPLALSQLTLGAELAVATAAALREMEIAVRPVLKSWVFEACCLATLVVRIAMNSANDASCVQ
jgi:hypothetical protein